MKYLTDVYNQVASRDADLEKQAAELYKQAEEEAYAGRITARGFADELQKLARFGENMPETIKSKPGFDLGNAGKSGQGYALGGKASGGQMAARKDQSSRAGQAAGMVNAKTEKKMPGGGIGQSVNRPGQDRVSQAGSPWMKQGPAGQGAAAGNKPGAFAAQTSGAPKAPSVAGGSKQGPMAGNVKPSKPLGG
jgi:hypothetical protein